MTNQPLAAGSSAADAVLPDPHLEALLATVEQRLAALGEALRRHDSQAVDTEATGLHRALADAVHRFAVAARQGAIAPDLRRRLARASGQVAAQRESLARATAALDRAIDVLMPGHVPQQGVYGAQGNAERLRGGGVIQA